MEPLIPENNLTSRDKSLCCKSIVSQIKKLKFGEWKIEFERKVEEEIKILRIEKVMSFRNFKADIVRVACLLRYNK